MYDINEKKVKNRLTYANYAMCIYILTLSITGGYISIGICWFLSFGDLIKVYVDPKNPVIFTFHVLYQVQWLYLILYLLFFQHV